MGLSTDVIIVGGGLSGLALADHLQRAGVDYQLFEARAKLGGRIKIGTVEDGNRQGAFDLGPAWFWPGQPRMRALIDRLGLTVFDQYATGTLSFEDERGQVFRERGYASMEGSYRIAGGLSRVIDGLAGGLDSERLHLDAPIGAVRDAGRVEALDRNGAMIVRGTRMVLALPPRVAETLGFDPMLPDRASQALRAIPTWMAGQAKIVAVYKTPFWRDAGLSGDAMSRFGPMVEIHDATDPTSDLGALFGFVGVPARAREGKRAALKEAALDQLTRLFGLEARTPLSLQVQDWAFEPETATEDDLAPPAGHPAYGLPHAVRDLWDSRLLFGSTETAPQFGGYLEGALEAAELMVDQITGGLSGLAAGRISAGT